MRFDELQPEFLRYEADDDRIFLPHTDDIAIAQGVGFLCPVCFAANGGPRRTHSIICWSRSRSRGVPDSAEPGPGRWLLIGNGYGDPSLVGDGGSNSVQINTGCKAHFFVTNGEIIFA